MLTLRLLPRRAVNGPCFAKRLPPTRCVSHKKKGVFLKPPRPPRIRTTNIARNTRNDSAKPGAPASAKPSLVEQLFPEESQRYDEQQRQSREVPPLPLEDLPFASRPPERQAPRQSQSESWAKAQLRAEMAAQGDGISVLVLRNASPNLTAEDFRRLIPQGRHIEGWTLDQGDILNIIPGRSYADLSQNNVYYLFFSSALSAFTYQGHVTRIHKLADTYTPTSAMSAVPPPPGYMVEGLDAHAAIQAYALVPPSQPMELRQLRPPFSPLVNALIKHQGYPAINARPDKSPYEARLTMDGPQMPYSGLAHILRESGKARGLSWSGGDNINVTLHRWVPLPDISAEGDSYYARLKVSELERDKHSTEQQEDSGPADDSSSPRGRAPPPVYIVGFHTEQAAMSFVQYWNRRPLAADTGRMEDWCEGDIPPIANVQLLW